MSVELADRFVDLACLRYTGDSPERWGEAEALRASEPTLVGTSVHAAAAAGDVAALRTWLDHEPASVRQPSGPRNWAPLLSLCYSRVEQQHPLECLELLLAHGADPNAFTLITECRFTALTGVIGQGEQGPVEQPPHPHARILAERLLDAGASANESQGLYNTHFLRSNAWLELLLARRLTTDLDYLLGQAVVQGFEERVVLLLAHGASPSGRNHYDRRTHLDNAHLHGHRAIARRLEAAGATAGTLSGHDAFRAACLRADATEAKRLLAADPTVAEQPGTLIAAARHGHTDALGLCLALGLPLDATDHDGLTALHHAAREGHLEIVRKLVARGASLTIVDPQYRGTPLGHARHFAGRWPNRALPQIVALLEAAERTS